MELQSTHIVYSKGHRAGKRKTKIRGSEYQPAYQKIQEHKNHHQEYNLNRDTPETQAETRTLQTPTSTQKTTATTHNRF